MTGISARRHEPVLVLPRARYGNRRQHWLAKRREGITATDAAVLLGVDPWQSPLSLYVDKTTGEGEDDAGEAAYWGLQLEHVVAFEWAKRNRGRGLRVAPTPGLLAHPERPWQMATIDRYTMGDRHEAAAPSGVLEVKTTDARNNEKWQEGQPPPLRVVAQVQHQLIVTGLDVAYVAALIGGNRYREWEVPFDPQLAEDITAIEAEFLDRLARLDPPAPIGHDADDAALDALFAADGTEATVDGDLVARRRELDEQIKALAGDKKTVEQLIKAQLGDATEGLVDGRPAVTWRQQTRASYTVPESTFRVLRFKPAKREKQSHADTAA